MEVGFVGGTRVLVRTRATKPACAGCSRLRVRTARSRVSSQRCVVRATATEVQSEPAQESGLATLLQSKDRRFVFVSGKGGVGKTTSSASLAVGFADAGLKTLILSTDPAHSLGDCLDIDLSSGEIVKVSDKLDALECDTAEAVAEFQKTLSTLKDVNPGENGGDISAAKDIGEKLGLTEFGEVFSTLPPGADEFVALAKVLRLAGEEADGGYERVVIDTAPTGHTLRLLAFPDFLETFLEKATALRKRLDTARKALNTVSSVLGSKSLSEEALIKASDRVDKYRMRMKELSDMLRDPTKTEFVVVAIPTKLSSAETKRLLSSLLDEGIWVRNLIVNQLVTETVSDTYLEHVVQGQMKNLHRAEESFKDYHINKVYRFDMEVRGVYGLRSFASVAFPPAQHEEQWPGLFSDSSQGKFVFVGGKGGVGKTSTSASMGVKLADEGLKTLVISTDPAHSLADALDVSLSGEPTPIEGTQGNLFAMEIDTKKAVGEFKELVEQFVQKGSGLGADLARRFGVDEFSGILENTPPGVDELVALTQVVSLVKSGNFNRVVVDTAPTGHTLRLLAFPEFLDGFLGKVLRLKKRIDNLVNSVKNIFSGEKKNDVDSAAQRIERFRTNMVELKNMLEDSERTQFCVVTIATDLAMAESERLVESLKKDDVVVNNIIVNQLIPPNATASYMKRRFKEQEQCLQELQALGDEDFPLSIVRVNYFDEEIRGVEKLQKMSKILFGKE